VLSTLDYSEAGFDNLKKIAITQLGAGHNGKLHMQFHNAQPWLGDKLNGKGPWPGKSNGSSYVDTGYQSGWE